MFDKVTSLSLLYDFYGNLLAERQREVIDMKYEEDLSLAEIASELGISRQAVHDAIKNGEKALINYEERLGLVERFTNSTEAVRKIDSELTEIIDNNSENKELCKRLSNIKSIIDGIEF